MKVEKLPDNTFSVEGFTEQELLTIYKKLSGNKLAAMVLFGSKVEPLLAAIEKALVIHT